MRDPQGRRTVAELVARQRGSFPWDDSITTRAARCLLTDDGELAHRLLHPRFGVEKTYRAAIGGRLDSRRGRAVAARGAPRRVRAAGAKVRVVAARRDRSVVDITIHEGRNRQVRRMFEALGHPVLALTRTRFGPLRLGALPPGGARPLTEKERPRLARRRRPADEIASYQAGHDCQVSR